MINPNDSIRYTNVVSKRYRFNYGDMNRVATRFLQDVSQLGVSIKGPFFYSLHNVPMDEMVNVEFFVSVREDSVRTGTDMYFHSYFSIEDMVSICLHKDIEKNTEVAYHMLLTHIEQTGLRQVTPIFHILSGDETFRYMFIKIGASPKAG